MKVIIHQNQNGYFLRFGLSWPDCLANFAYDTPAGWVSFAEGNDLHEWVTKFNEFHSNDEHLYLPGIFFTYGLQQQLRDQVDNLEGLRDCGRDELGEMLKEAVGTVRAVQNVNLEETY